MLIHYLYLLTFEFLCSGINFDLSGLVTFWFSEGQLLRPLVLLLAKLIFVNGPSSVKNCKVVKYSEAVFSQTCSDQAATLIGFRNKGVYPQIRYQ